MAAAEAAKVAQVVLDGNSVTTIINNLNALYSTAVTQLITYTVGVVAFVGLLLPAAISFLQNRQFRHDQATLANKIRDDVRTAKDALSGEIKDQLKIEMATYEARIAELKAELKGQIAIAENTTLARSHFLQAKTYVSSGQFGYALADFAYAATNFAAAKDEGNVQRSLKNAFGTFPNVRKADFEKIKTLEKQCRELLEALESLNVNGRYRTDIDEFETALRGAMIREPAPAAKV